MNTDQQADFPFDDPADLAVITTAQVLEGLPILFVTHDEEDGGWQMLCGTTNDPDDGRVIALSEAYALDPTVGEVANLPLGWQAWREASDKPWNRGPKQAA